MNPQNDGQISDDNSATSATNFSSDDFAQTQNNSTLFPKNNSGNSQIFPQNPMISTQNRAVLPPVRAQNSPDASRTAAAEILRNRANKIYAENSRNLSNFTAQNAQNPVLNSAQNSQPRLSRGNFQNSQNSNSQNSRENYENQTAQKSNFARENSAQNQISNQTGENNSAKNAQIPENYQIKIDARGNISAENENQNSQNFANGDSSQTSQNQNSTQISNQNDKRDDKIASEIAQAFEKSEEKSQQKVAEMAARNLAESGAKNAPSRGEIEAAHARYHTAWQNYYQKYYEKYYVSALEQQNSAYNQRLAQITERAKTAAASAQKNVADGAMTQQEAMAELRQDILGKIARGAKKVRKSRHFVPAILALLVILAALFVQYNGLIFANVAAFISPGDTSDQNIIIGTGSAQPVGQEPRIIIPKINVNAPVIYGLTDLSEGASQKALENGPIHYPISGASASPGENGNTVILGHSSADWFEPGNYKFIFVQLNRLSAGDLFYLDFQGVRYTYRITKTEIINPNEIGKLAIGEDKPYATLITCDPVGTALRRLIVYGEQISPDPSGAKSASGENSPAVEPTEITGKPPTLFEKIFGGGN